MILLKIFPPTTVAFLCSPLQQNSLKKKKKSCYIAYLHFASSYSPDHQIQRTIFSLKFKILRTKFLAFPPDCSS